METTNVTPRRRGLLGAVAAGLVAAIGLGGAAPAGAAERLDRDVLRRTVDGLPGEDVTGALVRVTGDDGTWWGTSGVADRRTGERVRSDVSFRIGSITKLFTGTLLLQLAGEGRVDLGAPVRRYLPGLLPEGYDGVTVGMLLDHTSGLPPADREMTVGDGSNAWRVAHRFDSWSPEQIVRGALRGHDRPVSVPGGRQQYNGVNSFVAGMLVERVTGRSYAHEVRSRITRPLGLGRTYVPAPRDTSLPEPHAHGYLALDREGGLADVTEQSPYPWAEGGMVSTAADLDRFLNALFAGRLLRPAQQRLLFTLPGPEVVVTDPEKRFSRAGLMPAVLPNGVEVWGKTGSEPGYVNGLFATKDRSRRLVYSLNYTNRPGKPEKPYILGIAKAAFTGAGKP
ncbi:serine hydrolase domain-containing protein [Streptomyces luteireticuli]|uniref:serine hydrolase domain-containing protein n=1 Tax=Streptomyces luteireticuli TaxID=173858 RepID=UPI003557952A